MNIQDDMQKLGELAAIGASLAKYSEAIAVGGQFTLNGTRWVMRPDNFVTLEPHWKRTTNVAISLRGNPGEYAQLPELPLSAGMAGYSECKVDSAEQLAAAAFYIRHAREIFDRGRSRSPKGQKVVET